ncbi:MAG TPA: hypothetical protein PLV72_02885 [Candidatus Magasanikbacteria bacterium]|nr:hypothetical protein [Candidatus Magasanikbacteria bacterium]
MERKMILTHGDYLRLRSRGGLVVVAGPMCAGKSTVLADIVFFAANTDTIFNRHLLCCPETDTRTKDVLNPREDSRKYSIRKFKSLSEIVNVVERETDHPYGIVLVDESHFPNSDEVISMVASLLRIRPRMLLVLGMLNQRADGKYWPVYRDLVTIFRLNHEDGNLILLTARCDVDDKTCPTPATHTYFEGKLPADGICPGASLYHPMCEAHWRMAQKLGWSPETGFSVANVISIGR